MFIRVLNGPAHHDPSRQLDPRQQPVDGDYPAQLEQADVSKS